MSASATQGGHKNVTEKNNLKQFYFFIR